MLDRLAQALGLGRKDVDLEDLFGEDDDDLNFNFCGVPFLATDSWLRALLDRHTFPSELARLYQAQALPLIYAHRLSTYHLHLLDRLAKAHGLGRKDVDLEDLFGDDDDDLSFGF